MTTADLDFDKHVWEVIIIKIFLFFKKEHSMEWFRPLDRNGLDHSYLSVFAIGVMLVMIMSVSVVSVF